MIYKICPADEWAQAARQRTWAGSDLDQRDGFIHFSTAGQVAGTLARHFAGTVELVLVAVDEAGLTDLRYQPSRDGALFPHLYGELPVSRVAWVKPLKRGPGGVFVLPQECQ